MSQISPPIRIVIVAAVAFLAAWMTVLKPKSPEVAPVAAAPTVTAPGAAGLGRAIDKAKGAKAAQEASDAKVQAATGETAAKAGATTGATAATGSATATHAEAAPALPSVSKSVLAKLPKDVRGAVARHRVVVLGVLSPGAEPFRPTPSDDAAQRRELAHVSRQDGAVVVRTVELSHLNRYAAIAKGAEVAQSPAVIVVDGKLHATRIDGFADRDQIDQAIADAEAATNEGLVTFKQRVHHKCARYAFWLHRSHSTEARARVKAHYAAALGALTPPAGQSAARLSNCS